MLFGKSIFQSVLTRLDEERAEDADEEPGESFRIIGLGAGFVAPTRAEPASGGTGADAYFAFLPDQPDLPDQSGLPDQPSQPDAWPEPPAPEIQEPPPAPIIPPHLLRLSEADIAEELAISAADTETTLADKRRRFAKANHPDGVALQFRDSANIRMQIANLLIDRAIKQLAWR
jgi:hypothetical protein